MPEPGATEGEDPAGGLPPADVRDPAAARRVLADPGRLDVLRRTGLLAAPTDPEFDRLVRLAARVLRAPVASLTLLDADRQYYAACTLPGVTGDVPLSHSLCRIAVIEAAPLIVGDVRAHPVLRDHPGLGTLDTVAYAGIPLVVHDADQSYVLGTLCAIDHVPRTWTDDEIAVLSELAAAVASALEMRLRAAAHAEALAAARYAAESSARRLATVLDALPVGVVITDAQGGVVQTNGEVCRLYGSELPIARDLSDYERYPAFWADTGRPVSAEEWPLARSLRTGTATGGEVIEFERVDGSRGTLLMSAAAVRDAEGRITGGVAVVADLTERRREEAQLQQALRLDAVGRLAGGVAHDLNNMLTAVIGYTEFLRTSLGEGDPRRHDVDQIARAADRSAVLTRQLLAFGRRQILRPEVLAVGEVLRSFAGMLRSLLGAGVEFVLDVDRTPATVLADRRQLEQVVVNLAANARDAMPRGGRFEIRVRPAGAIETFDAPPEVLADQPEGRFVALEVRDSGLGMAAEIQARIFEPFFTTKPVGQGTGLGLAMAYGIVKQSGGYLWVQSAPGLGTAFTICLPAAAGESRGGGRDFRFATEREEGSGTVLLVEDEETVRVMATRALRMRGFSVLEAADGREALVLLHRHPGPIHLVIADVTAAGRGGRELAERLAAERRGFPVLYMSSYTEGELVRRGRIDPTVPFLQKPFLPDQFLGRIQAVLESAAGAARGRG